MLFTRCPGCQTTFRISADTLRIANGAVRCGSCATVFSAFSGLRQDALSESMQQDNEILSPTLQTQELAGIEEIASPDFDEPSESAEAAAGKAAAEDGERSDAVEAEAEDEPELEDAGEIVTLETLAEESAVESAEEPTPAAPAEVPPPPSVPPPTFPPVKRRARAEETEVAEVADGESVPAHESSDKLRFEAPVDEWTLLLSEIEKSVDDKSQDSLESAEEQTFDDAGSAAPVLTPSSDSQGDSDLWDIGEPFSLEDWGDAPELGQRAEPLQRGETERTQPHADDVERAREEASEEDLDVDEPISAEEIDATLSAEPDPEVIAALELSLGQSRGSSVKSRQWALGCIGLLLVLGLQIVHHFRVPLATQPVIGAVVRGSYSLVGVRLVPGWDLEQYEITNWAATAGPGSGGAGDLHITAQIRNSGPRAQPYPSIELELKDRWEAVIGSRIFSPQEYLATDLDSTALMDAGASVPADLTVVDPGLDASGFELDVCLEIDSGRVSCAADRVFQ